MRDQRTQFWSGQPTPRATFPIEPLSTCPECHLPAAGHPYCLADGTLLASQPFEVGGRYVITERLGAGGMGIVFGARHRVLGKTLAIKVLRDEFTRDAKQVARFLREAQLASQIRHENVVDIQDFGRDETTGSLYLVMERLFGRTLAIDIATHAPMSAMKAAPILAQICRALAAAHDQGVVHRDLKPQNIFLVESSGRNDVVKLCDFGLSRTTGGDDRVTTAGSFLGTPAYMSPEQLRGDDVQDQRVDLYALGTIAYEILTGRLPFDGETPVTIITRKLTGTYRPLRVQNPGTDAPAELEQMIARCLASDPGQRPSGAQELERMLIGITSASSIATTNSLIGERAGSYRIVRLLGEGGVGSVYLGEHPIIGTKVAIKILLPEIAAMGSIVERFVQEARASTQIGSPHIPRYFDFGQLPDGRHFAVMEYLEGETLAKLLAREGMLSVERAGALLAQAARAMAQAHAAGILHRDLKPDNLFITRGEDGSAVVKVLDFGIAKLMGAEQGNARLTSLGVVVGTPMYCSPEQAAGTANLGPASDIYALGVIAFEALSGRPPFQGSLVQMLAMKTTRDPEPLTSRRPDLPTEVCHAVGRMIARDSAARPASMEEVAQSFADWTAPLKLELEAEPVIVSQKRRSRRGLVVVAAIVVVLAIGGAFVAIGGRSHTAQVAPAPIPAAVPAVEKEQSLAPAALSVPPPPPPSAPAPAPAPPFVQPPKPAPKRPKRTAAPKPHGDAVIADPFE